MVSLASTSGLFAIPDGLDQQLPQRSSLEVQLPQYIEDLPTQGLPRLLQLVEQLAIDIALPRLVRHEIPQVAHLRLANTMNAAEALLQPIGVPRQVVVHHQVSALQVDAFPGGICGEQHVHVGIVPERVLRLESIFTAHPAVNQNHGIHAPQQGRNPIVQITQRVSDAL